MSLLAGNSTGSVTGNSAGKSAGNLSGDTTGPGWIRRLWPYIDRHRRELNEIRAAESGQSFYETN